MVHMRTSGGVQVVIALSLVVVALGPFVAGPIAEEVGQGDRVGGDASPPDPNFLEPSGGQARAGPDAVEGTQVDREVRFVATLNDDAKLDPGVQSRYRTVYDREGARQLQGTASLSELRSLSNEPGVGAVRIKSDEPIRDRRPAPGVARIGADRLHEKGVTGEGVTVGVIDSGFQLDHPKIAGHVSAYRSFSEDEGNLHGTAVAGVVADTAPDAELHLAAVGPTTSPSEYRRAVAWLRASGADVIVDAGSYFGEPGESGHGIEAVAANASEDVVFVTSAGNYAQRHWAGTPDNGSERVAFAPDARKNHLNGGDPVSGRVTVSLRWEGAGDYDLYLIRELPMGDVVVERSTGPHADGDGGHERVSTTLPRGRYYVAIRANGTPETPPRLELFASHPLTHGTAAGSLTPPATADGVIAVGAADEDGAEPFSSRGPIDDGDHGVDVVAPDGIRMAGVETAGGTSFAAPYVAGTAALLESANPAPTPDQTERYLLSGATDVGEEGPDPATGHGRVNATTSYAWMGLASDGAGPGFGGEGWTVNASDAGADGGTERDRSPYAEPEIRADGDDPTDLLIAWAGVVEEDAES